MYPWWSICSGKHHTDFIGKKYQTKSRALNHSFPLTAEQFVSFWKDKYFTMTDIFKTKSRPDLTFCKCNTHLQTKLWKQNSVTASPSAQFTLWYLERNYEDKCKSLGKTLAHMKTVIILLNIYSLLDKSVQGFNVQTICHLIYHC